MQTTKNPLSSFNKVIILQPGRIITEEEYYALKAKILAYELKNGITKTKLVRAWF